MKRIRIVQLLGFLLVIIYIGLFIIDANFGLLQDMDTSVFSILLVLIGINLIHKGAIIASSSTLWFANNLIFGAITILLLNYLQLNLRDFIYIFAIIPIIPSLINLIILKVKIYVKVLILNASFIIPVLIFQFAYVQWYWILIVSVASLFLGVIICRNINLDKEKIDGKV